MNVDMYEPARGDVIVSGRARDSSVRPVLSVQSGIPHNLSTAHARLIGPTLESRNLVPGGPVVGEHIDFLALRLADRGGAQKWHELPECLPGPGLPRYLSGLVFEAAEETRRV